MTAEAIAAKFARHDERLDTLEEFVRSVKGTLNKIFVGVVVGVIVAFAGLWVRR